MEKSSFQWNDKKIEVLKSMLKDKIPYKDIATYFNTNKHVINRAVTRYNLAGQYRHLYQIGDENENWVVIDTYRDEKGRAMIKCECKCGCGEIYDVRNDRFDKIKRICQNQKNLIIAERNSKHINRESYKTRLIGQKFGNLLVLEFAGYNKNKQIMYKCECQCNNKTVVYATYSDLVSGKKDHCGCLTKQRIIQSKRKYNNYNLDGEFGIGWTTNTNKEFYFDLEDYDKIKDYCWIEHDNYIVANGGNRKNIRLHRLIMNVTDPAIKVDHIYHNTFDNRKSKLRIATNQENTRNHYLHSNNTSGVSGVNFEKDTGLWRARIFVDGKGIHLGRFAEFDDAVKARLCAEVQYFGKFSSQLELFEKYGISIPNDYEVAI